MEDIAEMGERSPEITHRIMSAVKGKDTEPEVLLRKELWKHGLRYRKNYNKLPGKPDIVFVSKKVAVFCDGDFWHGHNWAIRGLESLEVELSGYSPFWREKILGNVNRDEKNNNLLHEMGWTVIRIWESEIRSDLDGCVLRIRAQIEGALHDGD